MCFMNDFSQRLTNRQTTKGFTLVELMVVIAVLGMLSAIVMTVLSDAQRDAKDKRRVADLQQLQKALELYYVDHRSYPKQSEFANGNVATNPVFQELMAPYMKGVPRDPINNDTYFYYYDGAHQCGNRLYAVIFARQMEDPASSNYETFFNTTCGSILDGEGRGGGEESYNIAVGFSGG